MAENRGVFDHPFGHEPKAELADTDPAMFRELTRDAERAIQMVQGNRPRPIVVTAKSKRRRFNDGCARHRWTPETGWVKVQ
jgi:hypothetical protein